MPCSTANALSARSLYHVIQGETFVFSHAIEGALAGSGELRSALSGGALTDSFTVVVGAAEVVYSVETAGLAPGVYYFDLLVEDEDGHWAAVVRRAGLVVDPSVSGS